MDFAPDSDRALFLQGRIDQAMVDRLTPTVVGLHRGNPHPITVYVDSPGGYIASGRRLFDLIKSPNLHNERADLIVVVTGTAASAAADFTALADYSYLYPHSVMLYHGTRQNSQESLTLADAQSLAEDLRRTNESYALPLARKAVERFILRLSAFPSEFQDFLVDQQGGLDRLISALASKLGFGARQLVRSALQKQHALQSLTQAAMVHMKRFKRELKDNDFEAELLIGVLRSKLRVHNSKRWRLSEGGLTELEDDFRLLHDFHFGHQNSELSRLVGVYGESFLSLSECELRDSRDQVEKNWDEIVAGYARPRLQALWYFCVSMCRLLQDDDHWLSATDAYWLGLADEIIGASLPNLRELLSAPQSFPSDPAPEPATSPEN